jgi:hypothetical protein
VGYELLPHRFRLVDLLAACSNLPTHKIRMSCLAYERIRVRLAWNPDSKLGFIVYRCTYTSDDDWRRFMEFLDKTVHQSLVGAELEDVLDRLEWNVQEDVSLEEASFDTVRRFVTHAYNRIC